MSHPDRRPSASGTSPRCADARIGGGRRSLDVVLHRRRWSARAARFRTTRSSTSRDRRFPSALYHDERSSLRSSMAGTLKGSASDWDRVGVTVECGWPSARAVCICPVRDGAWASVGRSAGLTSFLVVELSPRAAASGGVGGPGCLGADGISQRAARGCVRPRDPLRRARRCPVTGRPRPRPAQCLLQMPDKTLRTSSDAARSSPPPAHRRRRST